MKLLKRLAVYSAIIGVLSFGCKHHNSECDIQCPDGSWQRNVNHNYCNASNCGSVCGTPGCMGIAKRPELGNGAVFQKTQCILDKNDASIIEVSAYSQTSKPIRLEITCEDQNATPEAKIQTTIVSGIEAKIPFPSKCSEYNLEITDEQTLSTQEITDPTDQSTITSCYKE